MNYTTFNFSIWLFDKDTKKQEIWLWRAKKLVKNLVIDYFWFGSIQVGSGLYTHENWERVSEPSLFVSVSMEDWNSGEFKSKLFIEDVKKQLNQESVMFWIRRENIQFL